MTHNIIAASVFLAILLGCTNEADWVEGRQWGQASVWREICEAHPGEAQRLMRELEGTDDPESGYFGWKCSDWDAEAKATDISNHLFVWPMRRTDE